MQNNQNINSIGQMEQTLPTNLQQMFKPFKIPQIEGEQTKTMNQIMEELIRQQLEEDAQKNLQVGFEDDEDMLDDPLLKYFGKSVFNDIIKDNGTLDFNNYEKKWADYLQTGSHQMIMNTDDQLIQQEADKIRKEQEEYLQMQLIQQFKQEDDAYRQQLKNAIDGNENIDEVINSNLKQVTNAQNSVYISNMQKQQKQNIYDKLRLKMQMENKQYQTILPHFNEIDKILCEHQYQTTQYQSENDLKQQQILTDEENNIVEEEFVKLKQYLIDNYYTKISNQIFDYKQQTDNFKSQNADIRYQINLLEHQNMILLQSYNDLSLKNTEMRMAAAKAAKWRTENVCINYDAWAKTMLSKEK